jgi:hypothetical protein
MNLKLEKMKKLKYLLIFLALVGSYDLFAQNAITTTPTSSSFTCNGTATLDTTNVDVASIIWEEVSALPVVFAAGVDSITNLCAGYYSVTFSLNGTLTTQYFTIVELIPSPCIGYSLNMSITHCSNATSCDGSATINVQNGVGPFSYWWVNIGTLSTNSLTNLCPGYYLCEVTDANGCIDVVEGIVQDSTQMTGDTIIFVNPGNCSNPIGMISDTVENCSFDYNTVSNVFIFDIQNMTNNPLDTVTVWWNYEDTVNLNYGSFTTQYTGITSGGCYEFEAVVYCFQKSQTYHQINVHETSFLELSQTQELSLKEKTIVRITDVMGKSCTLEPGKLCLVTYDDGSIERVFKVE